MGKILTIPVRPTAEHLKSKRSSDPRYIEGQRLLVNAMRYLVKGDPEGNRPAVELISEHVRTQFRMSDHPLDLNKSR
ncbi:MAG TPA: hypothetical protein VEG32_03480 [Clostridia bacterium]|nr:hypothetical protein [Clostridia bacterium]